jgi:hypothetical protein
MAAAPGVPFNRAQRQQILYRNWQDWVLATWKDEFRKRPPHYLCEQCRFVHWDAEQFFDVDHVQPFVRGGSNFAMNARVLCRGCNRARHDRQFIIPGSGYAYTKHNVDCNPDHLYHGAPTVTRREIAEHPEPFNPKRK